MTTSALPDTRHPAVPAPASAPAARPGNGASPGPEVCDVRHAGSDIGEMRRTLVSERAAEALAATFSVLGDPTRVRLLDALAIQELCVCDLAALVASSESAVSHQLRLLRSLRLVRSRRSGRQVYYRLDDDHIRRLLDQGRRHIEEPHPDAAQQDPRQEQEAAQPDPGAGQPHPGSAS